MRTTLVCLAALSLIIGPTRLAAVQADGGLNVMLTNDDGYQAPGIAAMKAALEAAGHRVTVVAPLSNQSGSGMSLTTSGTLDYSLQEEGVWSVDGKPVDAVALGLVHMMREDRPDLVVSGLNFGQRTSARTSGRMRHTRARSALRSWRFERAFRRLRFLLPSTSANVSNRRRSPARFKRSNPQPTSSSKLFANSRRAEGRDSFLPRPRSA